MIHLISMVESSSSSAKQRGVSLPRIQTSFCDNSQQHLQRPQPVENIILERATEHDHSNEFPPSLVGCQSKGGFFGFFGRGRSAAARKVCQTRNVGRVGKESNVQQKEINHSKPSQEIQENPFANSIHAPRPGLNYSATSLQHRNSNSKQNPQPGTQESVAKNLGPWDPPELFKAYPQAIRHVRLRAPLLNAETILHYYEATKSIATKEDATKTCPDQDLDILERQRVRTKREEDKKTKRSAQNIWSDVSWTDKIYLLTTSGHLLRYSGSGSYDRAPEKSMSLGKHSAAFVSDAIPGQHYVLQVSRVTKEDGTVNIDTPRSIFKKLGLRGQSRRVASNFLLVFDSPEDMNEWLVVLRKEIESVGGRKYLPDVLRETTDDAVKQVLERPSRRYLIQKDSDRFKDSRMDLDARVGEEGSGLFRSNLVSGQTSIRKSPALHQQKSVDSPSLSYMTTSTDQIYLEQLRGTPRLSYASAGGKTLSTSWGSSAGPSPARAAFFPEDPMTKPDGQEIPMRESSQLSPFAAAKHPMTPACSLAPALDASEQRTQRRTSTYSTSSEHTPSCPPPNFSVPSFSKRYSYSALIPESQKKAIPSTPNQQEKCADQPKLAREERRLSEGLNTTNPLIITDLSALSSLSSPRRGETLALYSNVSSALPHHFSLPASSGGNSSSRPPTTPVASPHPPPTTALPALPEQHHGRNPVGNVVDNVKKERPISLQGHNNPIPRLRCSLPQMGLQDPPEVDEYTLSNPSCTVHLSSPTLDPSRVPCIQPTLQQCKSMPQLSAGSLKPSATDLSLLPEVPVPLERAGKTREIPAGSHRACGAPGRLFRPVEVI